jgi:hypothetical protein
MSIFNRKLKNKIEALEDELQGLRFRKWKEEKYDYDLNQIKRASLEYAIKFGIPFTSAPLVEKYLLGESSI